MLDISNEAQAEILVKSSFLGKIPIAFTLSRYIMSGKNDISTNLKGEKRENPNVMLISFCKE